MTAGEGRLSKERREALLVIQAQPHSSELCEDIVVMYGS